jgi:hypothetical protein
MGYRTPNIDRIAKEGAMFNDWQIRLAVLRRALTASKRSGIDARDLSPLASPGAQVP